MESAEGWEQEAEQWVRWARTPGHDEYWQYGDSFFAEIVPPPGRATLEIGCGEGRVARDLVRRGHTVTAVDAASTLLRYAQEADPIGLYLVADATALPFSAGTFDIVVAYNALMDIQDMPGAVREAARVLVPGGHFCICVTHPLHDAGSFMGREADAAFTISGSYLGRRPYESTVERGDLRMTFRGWCCALEDYVRAMEEAGLRIDRLREPAAPAQAVAQRASWRRWQRVPMFLHLRAIKN